MRLRSLLAVSCLCALGMQVEAMDPELRKEAQSAIEDGVKWLVQQQQEGGSWSNPEFPALTALPLWALSSQADKHPEAVQKAVEYILSCVHEDGSIWRAPSMKRKGGGLATYNTAISMTALHALGREDLVPVIQRARGFLAGSQHRGDDMFRGGMGYDATTERAYADLSNSYIAYEAMRLTETVEDLRADGEARADLDWQAAIEFIERVQNRPESNDQPWASDDPENYGGFAYKPDSSQAGQSVDESGRIRLRSYGSMTYAGLLSFIHAKVDRSDPRVASAFDWAVRHWSLEENPGMGKQGLYYFYNVLAKALAVMGRDSFDLSDGSEIQWRTELVRKILSLRKTDPETGTVYWVNEENRWWEADPVLVTSYTLLALQTAVNQGEKK